MNNAIRKAKKLDKWGQRLPVVEVGEVCTLGKIWDGEGEVPEESYTYKLADTYWINYCFGIVCVKDDPLETVVKITNIELL